MGLVSSLVDRVRGAWTPRSRDRVFLWAVVGLVVSGAAIGCSGDEGLPSLGAGGPASGNSETCSAGDERPCGITLEHGNGVMSCFRGVQHCEGERWGACTDGKITTEPLPETRDAQLGRRSRLAYSSPEPCNSAMAGQFFNPCDPGCMYYDEDVPLNAGGAGMIGAGGVPDWGSPPATATCTHQLCEEGAPLDETCHPCVAQVCAIDATCCTGGMADVWDADCVNLVYTECGTGTPPPTVSLCDFAAFGDVNVRIGNSATGYPIVGSNGNVTPEPPAQLGGVYAKGTVDLRNGAHVLGNVVTEGNVWLEAPASIEGDVWAGGRVDVRNNSVLDGNITATGAIDLAAEANVSGNVWAGTTLNMSSNSQVGGWARSVGNMTGQAGATVAGAATVHPPSTIDAAIAAASKSTAGPVTVPDAPVVELPVVADFDRDLDASCALADTRPDYDIWSANVTLPPGVYGDVRVYNPYHLILQDGGSYVFNSLTFMAGSHLRLAGTAPWDVSVCSTYTTDNGHTVYLNGTSTPPNAQDFVLYSDATAGDCITIRDNNIFNGIVIAPNCRVRVNNGTTATAAIWAESIWTDTNFAITNIPIDDCEGGNQWGTSICDGTTPYYANGATYSVGARTHYRGQIYQCTNSGHCGTGGGFGGSAGYWPGEGANWMDAWILVGACPSAPPVPTAGGGECPATLDIPGTNGPYEACYSGLECQVNSRCTEVLTDASCAHSKCATGSALDSGCDPCVAMICTQDASCCSSSWTASCVDMVATVCDAACGTVTGVGCAHDACVVGVALDAACDPSVAGVCATAGFAYCCSTTWDQACVDQLYVQETGSPPSGPPPGESICDYAVMGAGSAAFNSASIYGNVGWFSGSFAMQEQWPGAGRPQVGGDLFTWGSASVSCTDIAGDYRAIGPGAIDGCSSLGGALDQPAGTLPTSPPRPDYSGIVTCPTGGPDNWSASGTLAPGVYGNVQLSGPVTLQAGDYFIQRLTTQTHDITLPADPNALVNIYVCTDIEFQDGADLISPGGNPFQAILYSHGGAINIGSWGAPVTIWGFIQANTGTITLSSGGNGTTVNGLAHSYYGIVQGNRNAVINASGYSRDDCINRGIDPTATPSVCPIMTNMTGSAVESGTCVDNGDTYQVDASICADVDLALGLSCDDAIPVCNHGNTDLPANEAVISFYPRNAQQFGVASPDPAWAVGTCNVTNAIPAGTCVDQVCPASVVNQDLTAMVTLTASATVTECSELDNWTYYVEAYSCTGGASVTTEVQAYEAICPDGTVGSWGFLTWDSVLMGNDTVTFEARTSNDGTFSGAYTLLGTAQTSPDDTSNCALTSPLADCPVDIAEQLWPGGMNNQPRHLELRITLNPVGADIPAVNDWGITYTCQYDQ